MANSNYQLAEMVNSTNYAAMSYNELVTINMAFHLAILEVTPLIEKKRAEEIATHTHEYVTIMNNYGTSKAEILACLEREVVRGTPYDPLTPQDVDDQTTRKGPESVRGDESPSDYSYLLLPAPKDADASVIKEAPQDDEANKNDETTSSPEEDKPHAVVCDHQDKEMHMPETDSTEVISVQQTKEPKSNDTFVPKTKERDLADKAIEKAKTMEIYYNGVDFNAPHYLEHRFTLNKKGSIDSWGTKAGNNLCNKDLEAFRAAAEKYEGLFLKNKVLVSTDEYLVTYDGGKTVYVYRYHFPEESDISEGTSTKSSIATSEELNDIKKRNSLMKRAIKKAKELSSLGESEFNMPFYDRYRFNHHGCNRLDLIGDRARYYEDASTLKDIMQAFETYARLCGDEYRVLTYDNCIAAMGSDTIYLVLFNIPTQEQKRGRKAKKSASAAKNVAVAEASEAVTSTSTTQTVDDLIQKAVDLTRDLPLTNGTEANSAYYLQSSFSVTNEGALIYSGKPFSSNVSLDDLNRCRRKHEKYARTMKASKIVAADGYTAFVSNDGNTITVYYYFTNAANACNS